MANPDYFVTYGSTPSLPISGWILDGSFTKQTLPGIAAVYITVWPAATRGGRQRQPGSTPVINRATASYTTDGNGLTLLQYTPSQADCSNAVGDYVWQWEVDSNGPKVDYWPDNDQLPIWRIVAQTS